jgi:hypothetical protein
MASCDFLHDCQRLILTRLSCALPTQHPLARQASSTSLARRILYEGLRESSLAQQSRRRAQTVLRSMAAVVSLVVLKRGRS